MIYLVIGHPRSGTSAMMSALEAGGLPVVKSAIRNQFARQMADELYHMNPRDDLYEPDGSDLKITGWPRHHDGKALKCVCQLVPSLAVHRYRAVFLRRDPEEIRQSAHAAYGGRITVEQIEQVTADTLATLRNRRDVLDLIDVNFRDLLADPMSAIRAISWPINVVDAAEVFDSKWLRFRREALEVGA